jgi:hypothetical protein
MLLVLNPMLLLMSQPLAPMTILHLQRCKLSLPMHLRQLALPVLSLTQWIFNGPVRRTTVVAD